MEESIYVIWRWNQIEQINTLSFTLFLMFIINQIKYRVSLVARLVVGIVAFHVYTRYELSFKFNWISI